MDRSPVRVLIEIGGDVGTVAMRCASSADWHRICETLRAALAEGTRANRCASAVVAVHFEDERCDHER